MTTGSVTNEGDRFFCVLHLTACIHLREGEMGTPVLDLSGNLLGMIIAGNIQSDSCTILPVSAIEKLHRDIIRFGRPTSGWVGAVVEGVAVPVHGSVTRVASVIEGSPAEASGLWRGDALLSIGEREIRNPEDVLAASFYLTPEERVRIHIVRGGKLRTLSLVCGNLPGAEAEPSEDREPQPVTGSDSH